MKRGESALEQLAEAWSTRHRGVRNSSRIAILQGDVEFVPVQMTSADAQFIESRRLSSTEVARIFRVPAWMIGADSGDSMTYSNTESQALAFVQHSLRPWLVAIEGALNADVDLFPAATGTYAEFKLDGLLRGDSASRASFYTAALNPQTGWMTRGEIRALENLPAEPERSTATDV